jgi:hypothetical protein
MVSGEQNKKKAGFTETDKSRQRREALELHEVCRRKP